MKSLKGILTTMLLLTGLASMAQEKMTTAAKEPKVYAIVNRANWCTVCQANGQRAGMVLGSYTDKGLAIAMNDLTDKTTKAASKKVLSKQGLYTAVAADNSTGVVTLVDAKTKKEIKHFSIAIPDEQIKSEIDSAL